MAVNVLIGSDTDMKVFKISDSFKNLHILTNCYHSIFSNIITIIKHKTYSLSYLYPCNTICHK